MQQGDAAAEVNSSGDDFRGFLQDMLSSTSKKLESMPKAVVDAPAPEAAYHARTADEAERRRVAVESRARAVEEVVSKMPWQETVQKRKEEERQRALREQTQARLAKQVAAAAVHEAFESERAAAQAVEHNKWLEDQWAPQFQRKREELRARRMEAEQRAQQEAADRMEELTQRRREAAEKALQMQWEMEAMAAEDALATGFVRRVDAECKRREAAPVDQFVLEAAQRILAPRREELEWHSKRQEQRRLVDVLEMKRKQQQEDMEYRQWREEVRLARCKREREEQRSYYKYQGNEERRKFELHGRDWLREKEMERTAILQDAVTIATMHAQKVKESGTTPRQVLEEACLAAEQQRGARKEPAKVEQELWDTLLTKNRLARQQESSKGRTPRWGVFAS